MKSPKDPKGGLDGSARSLLFLLAPGDLRGVLSEAVLVKGSRHCGCSIAAIVSCAGRSILRYRALSGGCLLLREVNQNQQDPIRTAGPACENTRTHSGVFVWIDNLACVARGVSTPRLAPPMESVGGFCVTVVTTDSRTRAAAARVDIEDRMAVVRALLGEPVRTLIRHSDSAIVSSDSGVW